MTGETKERDKVLIQLQEANSNSKKPIIFLVSQVGNEGLDFDRFSRNAIHFDGHYNPAVIDQRNGRIYRRDNTADKIRVKQILLRNTYDQRIKFVEEEKRKMKDFYLGDSTLNILLEKILKQTPYKRNKYLDKLLKFKINLEPKREYLLPQLKNEV